MTRMNRHILVSEIHAYASRSSRSASPIERICGGVIVKKHIVRVSPRAPLQGGTKRRASSSRSTRIQSLHAVCTMHCVLETCLRAVVSTRDGSLGHVCRTSRTPSPESSSAVLTTTIVSCTPRQPEPSRRVKVFLGDGGSKSQFCSVLMH